MASSPTTAGLAAVAGLAVFPGPASAGLAGTAGAPTTLAVKAAIAFLRSSPETLAGSGATNVSLPTVIEAREPAGAATLR